MAKGQKKSNREVRKPKQAKAAPSAAPGSLLASIERGGKLAGSSKGGNK